MRRFVVLAAALAIIAVPALATPPVNSCGSMNWTNTYIFYVSPNGDCSSFLGMPCAASSPLQFGAGFFGYNLSCSTHTFKWDFNDGTPPMFGQQVVHVFNVPGEYLVALTVANPVQTITITYPVLVGGVIDFSYHATGNVVRFTIGSVLPAGVNTFLEFGDGSFATFDKPLAEIVHTYASPGAYEVKLVAGGTPRVSHVVNVLFGRTRAVRH